MSIMQIHNCDVIEEIGTGGMAVVYKAVQNSLNRPVAIKELKEEYSSDQQVVARFMREATSLAALQHENIVQIFDFVKEGTTFRMLMEYVEGIDLFDVLEHVKVLPPSVAMVIALAVTRALEYAHYRGIIHRDIKPSNIIISKKGEVKLMDFGIARDENLGDLTRPGTSLGTPAYMSPEQIMGVKITFRSDVFSLGVVLYQMLTGQKPFQEDSNKTIMHKILNGELQPPRAVNPNIPRKLERMVLRCLAKEPMQRYESTGALRREIEAYLGSQVKIHHCARLVIFLQHKNLISKEEAKNFVSRRLLKDRHMLREDDNLPPSLSYKKLALLQGGLGAAALLMALLVNLSSNTPAVAFGFSGSLKIVVNPWAEIYIDGAHVGTTPIARPFSLTPGVHKVVLKNPYYDEISKMVLIEPGRLRKLALNLTKNKP